jgi:hypothetical protein
MLPLKRSAIRNVRPKLSMKDPCWHFAKVRIELVRTKCPTSSGNP